MYIHSAYSAYSAVTFAQRTKPGTNPAQAEPPFQSNNLQRLKNEPKPDQKRTEPGSKVDFFLQAPLFTLSVLTQFPKTPEPTEPHIKVRRLFPLCARPITPIYFPARSNNPHPPMPWFANCLVRLASAGFRSPALGANRPSCRRRRRGTT